MQRVGLLEPELSPEETISAFLLFAKSHLERCFVDRVGEVGARLNLSHSEAILFLLRDFFIVLK